MKGMDLLEALRDATGFLKSAEPGKSRSLGGLDQRVIDNDHPGRLGEKTLQVTQVSGRHSLFGKSIY